jgi:hypothetical protein
MGTALFGFKGVRERGGDDFEQHPDR